MSKEVIIKSNRYGINLILDGQIPFQELLGKISDKFKETGDFFRDSKMAVSFEGRELTNQEEQEIVDVITANSSVRIISIVDRDRELEEQMRRMVEAYRKTAEASSMAQQPIGAVGAEQTLPCGESQEEAGSNDEQEDSGGRKADHADSAGPGVSKEPGVSGESSAFEESGSSEEDFREEVTADFYKGNLRSGQIIESASSITVVGDVNPGAKVVSMGNVVILGSLKGNAQAGAGGNRSSFIFALEMRPIQLQIGDLIAKSPDKEKGKKRGRKKEKDAMNAAYVPQIAIARDGNICIEPMKKGSLNHL